VANRWDALLPNPRRQKLASPKHSFAQIVHTDVVTISVMFLRPKPAAPPEELPRMGKGMGAVNPLAHLDAEWLGVDPGETNMATVAHEERSAAGTRRFADTVLATYDPKWAEVSKPRWANAKFRLYCGKKRVVAGFWYKGFPSQPDAEGGSKAVPNKRVLVVDEFRTSPVSSAYSNPSEVLHGQPPESFR
ncbi:hypothetical protein QJQ45_018467, partial [Haematococcus lacustris]